VVHFVQQLVDGIGLGGTYALLALGLAVVFGVMHLVNFAHGEFLTVGGLGVWWVSVQVVGGHVSWWLLALVAVVFSVGAAVATEAVAFKRVRGADAFTLLLTSFGVGIIIQALFRIYVSPGRESFPQPGWNFDTVTVGGVRLEVYDLVVITAVLATLGATTWVLQRTMFGLSLRAAAEDFDAARLMGVRADRVIRGAFALSGLLAGIAASLVLIRAGQVYSTFGVPWLLKGLLAALIGGLGSLRGAVVGGLVLGITEVMLRGNLPSGLVGLTDAMVFALIAVLFIVRPGGIIAVDRVERV
jgi:branched-chain amino acid transport system permease protein